MAGIVGCLGFVAAILWHVANTSEVAMDQSMRSDIAWTGVNARIEASKLEVSVARYGLTGLESDAEKARLDYQILVGRMHIWGAGAFRLFIDESPARRARFDELSALVIGLQDNMQQLETSVARQSVLDTLKVTAPMINRIGGEAHFTSVERASNLRKALASMRNIQNALVAALIVISSILLLIMGVQNRRLGRARSAAMENAENYAFLAKHDTLTALPNRLAFAEQLQQYCNMPANSTESIAVFALDLDGFKAINDTLGHATGDALLNSVATRISTTVSAWNTENIVSRFGGDEFVILVRSIESPADANAKAVAVLEAIREPHQAGDGIIKIDASIGMAVASATRTDAQSLVLDADVALANAKSNGKGTVQMFRPAMRKNLVRRSRIEADMDRALACGEIVAFYQPQVEMNAGRVVGVEALARWRHPVLGWISPSEFVPVAETSGRIAALGRLVLETACRDAMLFPAEVPVSVNMSVAQLVSDDIVDIVADALKKSGLPPKRLMLEVTESVVMGDAERVIAMLKRLRALGVSIALDDFGTGYSALSYLRIFDWNEIKIDRSFVSAIENDPQCLAIIKTIVSLASDLGMSVVVEGVESEIQERLLTKAGCRVGQGFYYSAPVAPEAFNATMMRCLAKNTKALPWPDGKLINMV